MNSSASAPSLTHTRRFERLCRLRARMVISASVVLSSTSRISTTSSSSIDISCRQREFECRARAWLAFSPNLSAVTQDDPADDCKSDSGSSELFRAVQPLKYPEQLVRVLHVEPGAVVTYPVEDLRPVATCADFDARLRHATRVLERIGDQVDPYLAQQHPVALGVRQRSDFDWRDRGGRACRRFPDDLPHQR